MHHHVMDYKISIYLEKGVVVRVLKPIILILLSVLFIVYGVAFMLYRGIDATLISEDYYRSVVTDFKIPALVHEQLEEMIPQIVRDGITGGATITDPMMKAAVDSQVELISKAITDALDERWIADQATMVTTDLVRVLDVKANRNFTAVIEMEPKLQEIEANIAKGLEEYSDAALMGMFGAPKAFIPLIAQQIVAQLGLPERLVIADIVSDMAPGTIDMVKGYLGLLITWLGIFVMALVTLVFLAICILFYKRNFGLVWFGFSAALSGGLFLLIKGYLSNLNTIESLAGVDFNTLPVSSNTLQQIISFTFSKMNQFPLIFLVGGLVLVVLGFLLPRQEKEV